MATPVSLTLPWPPSANRYWRSLTIGGRARVVLSKEARDYKRATAALAVPAPIDGPVKLTLRMFRPARRGDLDNAIKVAVDSIQGVVFANDSQVVELHAYLGDDKHNPRVEVTAEAA